MERKHSFRHVVALGIVVLALGRLTSAQYSGGAGTPDDPYQIASAWDLLDLGNTPNDYDKHFVLAADIDLSGMTFDRAVIAPYTQGSGWKFWRVPFTGVFDGNNHVVRDFHIKGLDYLGLFGYLAGSTTVSDLGLENASIQGTSRWVGGLTGRNEGTLSNCQSIGTVTGEGVYAGGLLGENSVSLTDCYSNGVVTGNDDVAGLVGGYFGAKGIMARSFWNRTTSRQWSSEGGTGLRTAAIQDGGTYLDAGWDFVEETENGTDGTWWID